MMTDYIDRQAALDALGERPLNWDDNEFDLGLVVQFDADKRMLEAVPSVDVVKVVRCKDCSIHGICRFERGLGLNGFCSQGQQKGEII